MSMRTFSLVAPHLVMKYCKVEAVVYYLLSVNTESLTEIKVPLLFMCPLVLVKIIHNPSYLQILLVLLCGYDYDSEVPFLSVKKSYVVYPPEGPRPPSPEELREMAREIARKRNNQ